MRKLKEPKVLEDLHQIREQMAGEAQKIGITKYYLAMNKQSKWLLGSELHPRVQKAKASLVVRERTHKKYRAD